MAREDFDGVDLFGDPIPKARERAGRPEHLWTPENSNKINLLFATGHNPKDAAAALGITMPTLRKHYFSELEQWRIARLKLKARHLAHLHREGEAGNVAAIKELFKQMDRGELAAASEAFTRTPRKAKPAPLGKKAQLEAAAREGSRSGEWGQLLN